MMALEDVIARECKNTQILPFQLVNPPASFLKKDKSYNSLMQYKYHFIINYISVQ